MAVRVEKITKAIQVKCPKFVKILHLKLGTYEETKIIIRSKFEKWKIITEVGNELIETSKKKTIVKQKINVKSGKNETEENIEEKTPTEKISKKQNIQKLLINHL